MPVEIKVGPPVLTINQGTQFMVTDERGEIDGASEQGVFGGDTECRRRCMSGREAAARDVRRPKGRRKCLPNRRNAPAGNLGGIFHF